MGTFKDISGQRFGRLVVKSRAGISGREIMWLCVCDCGTETTTRGWMLKSNKTQSCGCIQREFAASGLAHRIHGHAEKRQPSHASPTYRSWLAARRRCTDPDNNRFHKYGALGVKFCSRWFDSFESFLADLGPRPEGTTLGRFGDTGNYEPGNCKWMTREEQESNRIAFRAGGGALPPTSHGNHQSLDV